MNFEVFTTSVELLNIPSYTTNITLEGQTLRLSFLWNERLSKRVLSVKSSTDVTYLQNTILHPNESFEFNSNAVFDEIPYTVTLIKTGDSKRAGNIFDWSKDFILCFSRTVDLDVKKLNVVYGVTTPSTPILPPPIPPAPAFGDWILNQGYEIVGNDIKYTAYKTNSLNYYDSFALVNLEQAVTSSLHDSDMQQWQAVKDAIDELTGVNDWMFDTDSRSISYLKTNTTNVQYLYGSVPYNIPTIYTAEQACRLAAPAVTIDTGHPYEYFNANQDTGICELDGGSSIYSMSLSWVVNENYDPNLQPVVTYISFTEIAQKIISNIQSEDQAIALLAETYVDVVANSIFHADESKQFVKKSDLIVQFETNKVLRV